MPPLWDPTLDKTQLLSSFPYTSPTAGLELPSSVSHTPLPLAAEAWGSSQSCFLGRLHSCSAGLAAAGARLRREKGRCWVVCGAAGVLSCSFSSLLLFASLCTEQNQSNLWFPRQRGWLSFLPKFLPFAVIARF